VKNFLSANDLVDSLQTGGALHSSGRFTVDLASAAPKLRQYQLSDPFEYVLKLVQSGVAAGASSLWLSSSATSVDFVMKGVSFPFEGLVNLLAYLLCEPGGELERSLRHLATAVNAAVGTRAEEICLDCWDGTIGCRVAWKPGKCHSRPFLDADPRWPEGAYTHFRMSRVAGDVMAERWAQLAVRDVGGMLRGERHAMDREQSLVFDRCCFAPVAIYLNRQKLPRYGLGGSKHGKDMQAWISSTLRSLVSGQNWYHSDYHLWQRYVPRRDGTGLAGPGRITAATSSGHQEGLTYERILVLPADFVGQFVVVPVQDGVELPQVGLVWTGPGSTVYTCADLLDKDLTGLRLVENDRNLESYQGFASEVLEVSRAVLAAHDPQYPMSLREDLEEKLDLGEATPLRYFAT